MIFWAPIMFVVIFALAITAGFWVPWLYGLWEQRRDREKNAAGDALADVAIALLRDEPASWSTDRYNSIENKTAGLVITSSYSSAYLYANGVDIPFSAKAQKSLIKARKEWAERKEQERIRQALATVGGKLHAINGGRA